MFGRSSRWGWSGAILFALSLVVGVPEASVATFRYGPVQLSGNVDTQWWIRHHEVDQYQFVQNRNTARLRFDWDWLQKGKLVERYDIPFIERSNLYILYRGVYDSFYDIAPGGTQKGVSRYDDIVGGPISGNRIGKVNPDGTLKSGPYSRLTDDNRNDQKWADNELREAYIDLKLKDLPLSFRLGRQQVIWGESDQFRLMDIWNPLNLTWHVQQENWDEIRVPLWLMKGIWNIGQLGPLSNTFVEAVYNPGDFVPGVKVDWLPNPWAIPIADPTRPGQIQLPSTDTSDGKVPQPLYLTPLFDLQGSNFRRGSFNRNPMDASDVGMRFHAVTPQGIEFTTNWLYARGRGIGAKAGSPFGLDIKSITIPSRLSPATAFPGTFAGQPVLPAEVVAEIKYPYTHIFGLTGNYFEGTYTNTVFRMEMAYQISAPFQTADTSKRVNIMAQREDGSFEEDPRPQLSPVGYTERDVWAGMLGFDRPTWIRWLNSKTTWFLTGQFFWSYVNGPYSALRGGITSAGVAPYFTPKNAEGIETFPTSLTQNNGFGQWDSGPYAGQTERTQNADPGNGALHGLADNVRQWELLTTIAATSFYRGGTIVPFIACAVDPVNQSVLVQLKMDYFLTNNLIMQVRQNYYGIFGGGQGPRLDPWGAGGLLARRDETGVRFTYQF